MLGRSTEILDHGGGKQRMVGRCHQHGTLRPVRFKVVQNTRRRRGLTGVEPNPSDFRTVSQDCGLVDTDHNVLYQADRSEAGKHPHNHRHTGNRDTGFVTLTHSVG